jgi:hypothetical protein
MIGNVTFNAPSVFYHVFLAPYVIYVNRMSRVVGVKDAKSAPSQGSEMGPLSPKEHLIKISRKFTSWT